MLPRDHWSGFPSPVRARLQNDRMMSSSSQYLNTSGGILSGPSLFPSFRAFFTRMNSSIEKGPSSMSRSSRISGLSASKSTPTLTGGAAKQVLKMIEPLVYSFFRACTTYSSARGLFAAAYLVHDPPGLAVLSALVGPFHAL